MALPKSDHAYLEERGIAYEIIPDANMTCVLFRDYCLPAGYDRAQTDLLIRLSAGYPDIPPDMWWFAPAIRLANGQNIPATDSVEPYLDRSWQRWSRHFNSGQWRPGMDSLESFLAVIRRDLERSVPMAA